MSLEEQKKNLETSTTEVNTDDNNVTPSHIMTGQYAILMETNDQECESWYTFIRVEGNEEALKYLQKQLDSFDWYLMDDLSTFVIELDRTVSASTAKEMTKIDLNSYSFHRKFDGKLQFIDLDYKKKDSVETKMSKTFDNLGYGQIEDYISDEDVDPEDLVSNTDSESESDSDETSSDSDEKNKNKIKKGRIPSLLDNKNLSNFAKDKKRKKSKRKGKKSKN